jgi:hypothetical protein
MPYYLNLYEIHERIENIGDCFIEVSRLPLPFQIVYFLVLDLPVFDDDDLNTSNSASKIFDVISIKSIFMYQLLRLNRLKIDRNYTYSFYLLSTRTMCMPIGIEIYSITRLFEKRCRCTIQNVSTSTHISHYCD